MARPGQDRGPQGPFATDGGPSHRTRAPHTTVTASISISSPTTVSSVTPMAVDAGGLGRRADLGGRRRRVRLTSTRPGCAPSRATTGGYRGVSPIPPPGSQGASTVHRIALSATLLAGSFVTTPASAAGPLVVDLGPGKVPGDVGIRGEETSRIHDSPIVGPTRLITNVTRPTLTVYRPPADRNTGTAMIICPGGGYWDLYWELEGEEVAAWLNEQGMTGIIVKYRCPRRPGDVQGEPPLGPQIDAQRAVRLVRSRAEEWGIDPGRIGMVGFSAGGGRCGRRAQRPARLGDRLLLGLLQAQRPGRRPIRPHHPGRHAAGLPRPRLRRRRAPRGLGRGEQRLPVPGLEAGRRPACNRCDRRP